MDNMALILFLEHAPVVHLTLRVVNEKYRQLIACGVSWRLMDGSDLSVDRTTRLRHTISDGCSYLVLIVAGRAQRNKDQSGKCVSDETRSAK
jgi:hypothetical protein